MEKSKITQAAKATAETVFSALILVLLYIVYIPFGISRALFSAKAVRDFYADVSIAVETIAARLAKRKETK